MRPISEKVVDKSKPAFTHKIY